MLNQSLIGAISNNFKEVNLSFEDSKWIVTVYLYQANKSDELEVFEIVESTSGYIEDIKDKLSHAAYKIVQAKIITVDENERVEERHNIRVIFRRRE